MYNKMDDCYYLESIFFQRGLLDNIADAIYILTMENSKRQGNFMKQIYDYQLHKNIFIMKNKGFKNCDKVVCNNNDCKLIDNTESDAVNAYINAFKHALSMKYDKIIILEDDFICSPELKNQFHIANIEKITRNMPNNLFSFGVLPFVTTYHSKYIRKCWISSGAHATLIPKYFFDKFIKNEYNICEMDFYLNMNGNKYIYYKPLVLQTFPITDNFKNWGNNCSGKLFGHIFRFFMRCIIKTLNLDNRAEPGTSIMYVLNALVYDLVVPLIILKIILKKIYPNIYQKYLKF